MLNIEYFRKDLLELKREESNDGIGVKNGIPVSCVDLSCSDCDFVTSGCGKGLIKWLCKEYDESESRINWDYDIDWTKVPVNTEVLVSADGKNYSSRYLALYVPNAELKYVVFDKGYKREDALSYGGYQHCILANITDVEKYRKEK